MRLKEASQWIVEERKFGTYELVRQKDGSLHYLTSCFAITDEHVQKGHCFRWSQ